MFAYLIVCLPGPYLQITSLLWIVLVLLSNELLRDLEEDGHEEPEGEAADLPEEGSGGAGPQAYPAVSR